MTRRYWRRLAGAAITIGALGAIAATSFSAPPMAVGATQHSMASGNSYSFYHGRAERTCATVHWQVTDVPNQAMITNWNSLTGHCGLEQSAIAKCVQRGSYKNFDGPWRTTEKTSQGICGTNYDIYCAGIRFKKTSGGPQNTEWAWPTRDCDPASPPASLTAAQHVSCVFNFTSDFNDSQEPIWAQSRKRSSTTCDGWQQRSILHWCLRGVCTGGWNYGPWRTSTSSESRATASQARASFKESWIQIRQKAGDPAYCWETGPGFGSAFVHCGNTP